MTEHITLSDLQEALQRGGSNVLVSKTLLEPASGKYEYIAPARYASGRDNPVYATGVIFTDGDERPEVHTTVVVNSKSAQLNLMEHELENEAKEHPQGIVAKIPTMTVHFNDGQSFSLRSLPHRIFDAHVRFSKKDNIELVKTPEYQEIRNATLDNSFPLLQANPEALIFGVWDSHRQSHQNRRASVVTGEIYALTGLRDGGSKYYTTEARRRTSAKLDPFAPGYKDGKNDKEKIFTKLHDEFNQLDTFPSSKKNDKNQASGLGLGHIPPNAGSTAALDGISTEAIIRDNKVSFSALRALKFGEEPAGNHAIRVLLAALALHAIALSEEELNIRANCHLKEVQEPEVYMDLRYGKKKEFSPLQSTHTRKLLEDAYIEAKKLSRIDWLGQNTDLTANENYQDKIGDPEQTEQTA